MSEIMQGDNGTVLEAIISDQNGIVDIRSSTVKFILKTPTRRLEKVGTVTDGLNGKAEVVLASEDVSDVGNHVFQCEVSFPSGSKFSSSIGKFKVAPKL